MESVLTVFCSLHFTGQCRLVANYSEKFDSFLHKFYKKKKIGRKVREIGALTVGNNVNDSGTTGGTAADSAGGRGDVWGWRRGTPDGADGFNLCCATRGVSAPK